MNFDVYVDGRCVTISIAAYIVALLWHSGLQLEDVPGWLESLAENNPEAWSWSEAWGDTFSDRFSAICLRRIADPMAVNHAEHVRERVLTQTPMHERSWLSFLRAGPGGSDLSDT